MSYNFKSLGEVELLDNMPESANVLVEVDGGVRRAPQVKPVDEIAQIVGSETLEEVPEAATVLAEVGGEIKRVPSKGLGGGSLYDMPDVVVFTWDKDWENRICNKTFEEVLNLIENFELRLAIANDADADDNMFIGLLSTIITRDESGSITYVSDHVTNIKFADASNEYALYLLDDNTITTFDPVGPS